MLELILLKNITQSLRVIRGFLLKLLERFHHAFCKGITLWVLRPSIQYKY